MTKFTEATLPELKGLTAEKVRGWHKWLKDTQCGCCRLEYFWQAGQVYSVCMGWHDCGDEGYKIAWKIGRQSVRNCMQCDFDLDFEMPYDEETGDVDDTLDTLETVPEDWEAVAAEMRAAAVRIANDWIVIPEEEETEAA